MPNSTAARNRRKRCATQPRAGGPGRNGHAESLWAEHHRALRDPHQVAAQWEWARDVDPRLLQFQVQGDWWEAVAACKATLVVSREYEHLLMGIGHRGRRTRLSYFRVAHPSGLAFDPNRGLVHVASTRNPNMLFDFAPSRGALRNGAAALGYLLPVRSRYLPGALYLHDLAMIGKRLHANAVGLNAVVRFPDNDGFQCVWWPRSIDGRPRPRFDKNYLQLNSIAAGPTLATSCFSASAATPSGRRPGHLNFPVDGRGVLFSGKTREVVATGLTRPHSARFFQDEVWIDNSGYGEFGRIVAGRFEPVVRLPGWTRGLCFCRGIAFVGTSRVIPRYRQYAPGLAAQRSQCALHAIDMRSGKVLGSLTWPAGNQIFAIEALAADFTNGFPFDVSPRPGDKRRQERLFFQGLRGPWGQ
jgi:uncharacterized protein (TIGR03032 family)